MALEYEVRAEFQSLSLSQLLDASVNCFEGVGDTQSDILNRYFGITTVRQLGNMPFFLWALGIQEMALQGGQKSTSSVEDLSTGETLKFAVRENERGKNPVELLNSAVNVLDGLAPGQNLAMYDAFRITNVVQLAHNRIMLEARVIEYLEKHPELLQSGEAADKNQVASILGADTFVPSTADEAQQALTPGKPDEKLSQMAGDLGDHLRGRIDALKERAAERAKSISSEGTVSGAELAEDVESGRQAASGGGAEKLESIRQLRERAETTRVQTVSPTSAEDGPEGAAPAAVAAAAYEGTTGVSGPESPAQPSGGEEPMVSAPVTGATPGEADGEAAAPAEGMTAEGQTTEGPGMTTIRPPMQSQEGAVSGLDAELAGAGEPPDAAAGESPAVPEEEREGGPGFKPWMAAAAAAAVVVVAGVIWLLSSGEEPAPPGAAAPDTAATQTEPTQTEPVQAEAVTQAPPPPPPAAGPPIRTIHTVTKGQSLWRISRFQYQNPLLWPEIFEANSDQIEDPDLIFPKQRFKIPEIQ